MIDSIEDLEPLSTGDGPQLTVFHKQYNVVNDDMEQPKMYKGIRIKNRVYRRRVNIDDESHFDSIRV